MIPDVDTYHALSEYPELTNELFLGCNSPERYEGLGQQTSDPHSLSV